MKPITQQFKQKASQTIDDEKIQNNLLRIYDRFDLERQKAADSTPNWEHLREKARVIKDHTIENLDYYLKQVQNNVTKTGGKVYFAKDAATASRYVLDLARDRQVKTVIKGKSMISEEMGLNHQLIDDGVETVETDLGEYLIQLRNETPYHIFAPAIHMSKEDVSTTLHEKIGTPLYENIEDLAGAARHKLRNKFITARST